MKLTEISINHKITIFTGLFITIIVGLYSYFTIPREAAPDIPIPIIMVSTVYPGVAPQDIETLVTIPIEKKLKELSNVQELTSTSLEGISFIQVEFGLDVNLDQAFQKVREKVDLAKPDIPEDAEEPVLTEINVSEFPVLIVIFTGDIDILKLEDIADNISDKIETINGVLDANVTGGLEREIQVLVDPMRLEASNLSLNDVIRSIQMENVNIPGGTVDIKQMKFMVRIPGEFEKVEDILNIVVKAKGGDPVFIRDVAAVKDGFKERSTYARFDGKNSITLTVRKRAGENSIRIVNSVKELLNEEKKNFPKSVEITTSFDQSKEIKMMINDLENSILSGVILIVIVILFFLGLKNSIFVALAIPFSMLLTFMIVDVVGFTLNMVVLFSLILAVGMLVDNAIVIVENIYRHREEGMSKIEASNKGTSEVGWAVIASTATTIAAFFPLVFWPDIVGQFMSYLPKTVIIVLLSSLFVAFVVNPVFCSVFMNVKSHKKEQSNNNSMYLFYERFLTKTIKHRFLTMGASFLLLIAIIVLYAIFGHGVEFFPQSDPMRAFIDVNYPEGINLETSNTTCKMIEKILLKKKEIKHVITTVGNQSDTRGAFFGGGSGSPNLSRVMIEFYDYDDRIRPSVEVIEEVRREIEGLKIPGAVIQIQKEQHGPPQDAPIKVEVTGDDYDVLGEIAGKIKRKIEDVDGLVDLKDDYEAGRPEYKIIIDREKASRFKLNTHGIAMTIRTAINGTEASKFRDGDEEYDITVRLPLNYRNSFNDILNLNVSNNDGEIFPLSHVTKIKQSAGWGAITRKDNRKTVSVLANNAEGYNANFLLKNVRARLNNLKLPRGYTLRFSGQHEEQEKNQQFLNKAFLIALFLIIMILVTEFNSITMPLIIMTSVFLSLFGVFTGLLVTRTPFGIIMTGIGVISLAGVVVNNAIVLIDYIGKLRERGMEMYEAVIKAGCVRLRPVLLTAITTIVGLIPLTTGIGFDFKKMQWVTGSESSEWWGAMGVAVIFGLAFSTVLTLIIVPVMYTLVEDFNSWIEGKFSNKPK